MHDFTPIPALIGGALIGLASAWLLTASGRIAGVSGILHGMFHASGAEARWRGGFIAGLLLAGLAWQAAGGAVAQRPSFPILWVVAAGLMVGFGTRMSGGCTSGHGVCGISRLSMRSLIAVLVFMTSGMAATYVARHVLGLAS